MGASVNTWQKKMTACREVIQACLESKEPTSVETDSVAVHEVVPKQQYWKHFQQKFNE
jgi:hypothetical protein